VRVGIIAGFGFAVLLVACSGAEGRKSGYLAKGQEYLTAHNYAKARLEFRNALQLDPNDAQASFLAGEAAERLGDLREAVQMYRGAIDTDPKHLGARAHLALLYAYGGAPDKAMEIVEPGLTIAPNDPDLLAARAAARMRLGDKAAAQSDAERAVLLAPADVNAVTLLAAIYQQSGHGQQAIDLVTKALQAPKPSVELKLVLAQLYLANDRHPEAVQEMKSVIAAEPGEFAYRYRLAQMQLADKDIDAAESTLRAAVARAPTNAQAKLALAQLLAANRSYEIAETELRSMVASSPRDYQLRLGLGQFYLAHDKAAQADAVYRQIIKDDDTGPSGLIARDRLARMYVNSNQGDAAALLIEEVLKKNPRDNDALLTRADLSMARGNADAAIADLRAVQRDQPNSVPIQRALARAYLKSDDPTLAEETLRAAAQANASDIDLQLDLANLFADTGRIDQAATLLQRLAAEHSANVDVLKGLFKVQMARRDYAGARHSAELVQAATPALPAGIYMSGEAELADGKIDAARADFERAAASAPDSLEPFTALVRLDLQQHPDQAIGRIDKAISQHPNNPVLQNLKGEALTSLKRNDAAIASFKEAIRLQPNWIEAYHNLAVTQMNAGHSGDAIKTLQDGVHAANQAPALVSDLATVYEHSGHPDEAMAQYEGLIKRDNSDAAANNLAMLLVTYRTDQTSLDRARTLTNRFSNSLNPAFVDTRGWVLYKHGEYADAVTILQKAVEQAPQAPELRYHLAMAQLGSGARELARSNLEQTLKSNLAFRDSDDAKKTLAILQH
jgi:tetratricopeptide (TPR) repeat protein